eukprot:3936572-Rhodomonas_salina.1
MAKVSTKVGLSSSTQCSLVGWGCSVFQIDVRTDTKTKDNVTLTVTTAIQCAVDPERAHDYYFKLSSPHAQVSSYVHDCIRSLLPSLDLDKAFESKDAMAHNIKDTVAKAMEQYGVFFCFDRIGKLYFLSPSAPRTEFVLCNWWCCCRSERGFCARDGHEC